MGASLLAVVGCGQSVQDQGSDAGSSASASTTPPTVGTCRADDPALLEGPVIARADLDGDGTADPVRRTTVKGCVGALIAQVGGRTVAALPEDLDLGVRSARAVTLPGRTGQLLVVEAAHPRGGASASVLAYADGRLALLERPSGTPLVPFQPTDVTPATRTSLSCGPGSTLLVREVVTHEPVGILAAFDVRQTAYRVRGTELVAAGTTEVADNVLPEDVARRFPGIVARRVLMDGCG